MTVKNLKPEKIFKWKKSKEESELFPFEKFQHQFFISVDGTCFMCERYLGGGGFGFYLITGNEESNDEESHSSEFQASDSTHNENSHQPTKTIEEIENEIENAEKDSVTKDIIDAAEALQFIR